MLGWDCYRGQAGERYDIFIGSVKMLRGTAFGH